MDPQLEEQAKQEFFKLYEDIGKSAVNALFPNDFEFYLISLELVDYKDQTLDLFSFPVMPKNISEVEQSITNIKKTLSGVVSIKSTGFVPRDIRLTGNFGRSFKLLLGRDLISAAGLSFTPQNTEQEIQSFSNIVKTGYGCFKLLESILQKSKLLDDGLPRRLYFYNPAIGNSYLVEFMEINKSSSQEENMIWGYSLFMRAIAPLSGIKGSDLQTQIFKNNSTSVVQNVINNSAKTLIADLAVL